MGKTTQLTAYALSTALGVAMAVGTAQTMMPTTAQASASNPATPIVQASDGPPCGYDVYHGRVYVTSLGKAKGTARVIKWRSLGYKYKGEAVKEGTLVGRKHIDRGETVKINPNKRVKANRITVDIVKGKLTANESRRKVWHCEAA